MSGLGINLPSPNYAASSRSFILPSPTSSSASSDDVPLPFPAALPRSDFLAPSFDPAEYLSSLSNRHQTLEDLRSDLRERSTTISNELLELVNANYTSFLSLGSELKGGEDKVEDVRVALLGFQRAVEEIKSGVAKRGREVGGLNAELRGIRSEVESGRQMLQLDERLSELEAQLELGSTQPHDEDSEDEDEDDEGELENGTIGITPSKLVRLSAQFEAVEELSDIIGKDTPFVKKTQERVVRCRNTLLLDLATALREAKKAGPGGQSRLLRLMGAYAAMDAQGEAIKVLKGL